MGNIISKINKILDIDQTLHGMDYLKEFIKNISLELDVKYVFIGHQVDNQFLQVQTDTVWANNDYVKNFIYDLKDTPCALVLSGKRVCIHECDVVNTFPKDLLLKEMGVESYVGAPILIENEMSGLFVILDDKPMENREFFSSICEFLALRASAELEKTKIEDRLKKQVKERTLELEESNKKLLFTNKELSETITKLEKTQAKLIESEKLASLGGLVAGVAHEINTPLGIALTGITYFDEISGNIHKLYNEENMSKEDFEKYLDESKDVSVQVLKNIRRASDLVQTFKQVSADQTCEGKREFYIKDYIDGIILSINNQIEKTKIVVNNNIPSNIKINSYPGAFAQIITNLIINSLVHGYTSNDEGVISLEMKEDKNSLVLNYKDDGKGIKETDLPYIFEPFFTTKRGLGGTGLGLHILYNIIKKQFHGDISCKSKQNCGVDFEIIFPLEKLHN